MTISSRSQLHYEVHGSRGPHVLLVHGMLSSRAQWAPNLAALTPFARPVVVELLGHGRSPAPADPRLYSPESYCREFERIREALGAARWFVVGQSLGAALTLRYALDHPSRVVAQVFTNSNSAFAEPEWGPSLRPAMEALGAELAREGRGALERMAIHPKHGRLPRELQAPLVADAELHSPQGVGLTALHTVTTSSVRAQIHANTVPSLLVVGERESRFAAHCEFAEKAMPQLRVVRLPAGHAVNLHCADAFNRAVVDFLAPHVPARSKARLRTEASDAVAPRAPDGAQIGRERK